MLLSVAIKERRAGTIVLASMRNGTRSTDSYAGPSFLSVTVEMQKLAGTGPRGAPSVAICNSISGSTTSEQHQHVIFRRQGTRDRLLWDRPWMTANIGGKAFCVLWLYSSNFFSEEQSDSHQNQLRQKRGQNDNLEGWFMENSLGIPWEMSTVWQNLKKTIFANRK